MTAEQKGKRLNHWLLGVLIAALCCGYWGEMLYMRPSDSEKLKQSIEERIQQERAKLSMEFDRLVKEHQLQKDSTNFILSKHWERLGEEEMMFWIYRNDTLLFWNSNKISAPTPQQVEHHNKAILQLFNASVFFKFKKSDDGFQYIGVLPLKMNYPIENAYIQSHFNPAMGIPEFTSYSPVAKAGWNFISDKKGNILFHLHLDEITGRNLNYKILGVAGFLLALLLLFLYWSSWIRMVKNKGVKNQMVFASFALIFVIVSLISYLNAPVIFYETKLFSPEIFGAPGLFSNLGVFLVFSLLWGGSCYLYYDQTNFVFHKKWSAILALFVVFLVFHELARLFLNLVGHSTITFELNKIFSLDLYSLLAHLILLSFFGGWYLLAEKVVAQIAQDHLLKLSGTINGGIAILVIGIYSFLGILQMSLPLLVGGLLFGVIFYARIKQKTRKGFLLLFSVAVFVAVLGITLTWNLSRELDSAREATLLMNRASGIHNEHDPFAEMGLMDINKRIHGDKQIQRWMDKETPDLDRLDRYIRQKYFSNRWRQYDIQLVICWPETSLDIAGEEGQNICYNYFQEMIAETGKEIDGNGLFYLDNKNGRISYFIWQKLHDNTPNEVSLFIDIESRLSSIGSGYPELLKDKEGTDETAFREYSFARYVDDVLISHSGDFLYNTSGDWLEISDSEFSIQSYGNYEHLLYCPTNDSCFVLSKPSSNFVDILLYFIYLFLYLFVTLLVLTSLFQLQKGRHIRYQPSLEVRIRSGILYVLLLSFLLVGFASVYYNFKQYRGKQIENLKEKTQSVLVMLDQVTGEAEQLEDLDKVDLVAYLRSISNSLYVDVNLYAVNGHLAASSRPELFNRGLQSREMNPSAYKGLHVQLLPWSLQSEYLGKKRYLSAYKTLYNWNNQLLGYVNLPHFVSSDVASRDQMDFIVVLLNIYLVFVLLSILITVVLSRRITRPLQVIKDKLSGFRLRERNEKIDYEGHDEIASLVKEYNRLVDELESGAEQLATSERTSAWQQMARQIAHEIKNPLTPMKLSIQHLQRAKKDQHEKFDTFFERTTITLIEQIENLNRIASEFSSFSKMSASHPEKLNILEPIESVVAIFKETENLHLKLEKVDDEIYVWADKEQLIQVFNNLVKNATQAIPKDTQGDVLVSVSQTDTKVLVSVADNGTGIAEEAKVKLFEPNFTTKRTGMGIGLAITRNIIHSFKGEIWFEENQPNGAIFFVQLPKYTFS